MTERENYSLLHHNTFGIEASAAHFITYDSVADLQSAIAYIHSSYPDKTVLHIGGGSNLLFLSDFDGVILHSAIQGVTVKREGSDIHLRVGAGVVWDDLVAWCVSNAYYGLENLSWIPGEVGAAAVQNIGAYGAEAKDVITEVETVDLMTGALRSFQADECEYAYRKSVFKTTLRGRYAVTYVHFRLSSAFVPRLDYARVREVLRNTGAGLEQCSAADVRRAIIDIRRSKLPDPKELGNAGSFFMNPVVERAVYERIKERYPDVPCFVEDDHRVKIPAGWLIERCGWKGRSLGRAAVHDRQALVLVNKGHATGQDILALCNAVRSDVFRSFGIEIQPEVNIIGGTPQ